MIGKNIGFSKAELNILWNNPRGPPKTNGPDPIKILKYQLNNQVVKDLWHYKGRLLILANYENTNRFE